MGCYHLVRTMVKMVNFNKYWTNIHTNMCMHTHHISQSYSGTGRSNRALSLLISIWHMDWPQYTNLPAHEIHICTLAK